MCVTAIPMGARRIAKGNTCVCFRGIVAVCFYFDLLLAVSDSRIERRSWDSFVGPDDDLT